MHPGPLHSLEQRPLLPADPVDVLTALGLRGGRAGVPEKPGLCPQRTPQGDRAFEVNKASSGLAVPTNELFPGEWGWVSPWEIEVPAYVCGVHQAS